jgi:hypothetical protein
MTTTLSEAEAEAAFFAAMPADCTEWVPARPGRDGWMAFGTMQAAYAAMTAINEQLTSPLIAWRPRGESLWIVDISV